MMKDNGDWAIARTKYLSEAELTKLVVLYPEAGTGLPHLVAEARRWKALAGRLGLSLDILLDTLSGHAVRRPCLGAAVERILRDLQCLDVRCDREDPDVAQVRL